MGIVLAWSSNYPTVKDTVATNYPQVSDGVHDVLSSHVNSLASAVVALQSVVGGLRAAPIQDPLSISNGEALIWNSTNLQFEPGPVGGTEQGNIGNKTVDLTGLQDGDIVVYDLAGDEFIRAPNSGGGGGGITRLTGANYAQQTLLDTELLIGGFMFDPSVYTSPGIAFQFYGILQVATAGTGELRLYDMGAPGTPEVGTLRSTAVIPNASAGANAQVDVGLTPVATPTGTDEIFNAKRMYELRLVLVGANAGDVMLNLWGGLVIS